MYTMNQTINCGGKLLSLSSPIVMGILNLTPDSFYDGGKQADHYLESVEQMLEEGAGIIDIGGMSTRPKGKEVEVEEELNRVIGPIEQINQRFPEAILSIDTYRARVAKEAIGAGAHIVNDISGGTMDDDMFPTMGILKVPYILSHIQGNPSNMQDAPHYEDVVIEVMQFFARSLESLNQLGVADIIIDPGFGFGKTLEHNYALLHHLNYFSSLHRPILAGISRKSMINKVIDTKAAEALNGTSVLNTIALLHGASILRVHDVKEAVECVKLVEFMRNN